MTIHCPKPFSLVMSSRRLLTVFGWLFAAAPWVCLMVFHATWRDALDTSHAVIRDGHETDGVWWASAALLFGCLLYCGLLFFLCRRAMGSPWVILGLGLVLQSGVYLLSEAHHFSKAGAGEIMVIEGSSLAGLPAKVTWSWAIAGAGALMFVAGTRRCLRKTN